MNRSLRSLLTTTVFCLSILGCQSKPVPVQEPPIQFFQGENGAKEAIKRVYPPAPKPSPEIPLEVGKPPIDFSAHEWSTFSQAGEDGVLEAIFEIIEPTTKYFVEFGAGEGVDLSNARHFVVNHGWKGLLMEGDEELAKKLVDNYQQYPEVKALQAWIYPGNIETLLRRYGAPKDLDVISIDIDSNDYYIWKVMHEYRPKVVVIEYNPSFAPPEKMVVEFSPFNYWDGSDFYGASLQSLYDLGKEKGYELVHCTGAGNNAIFVDGKYYDRFKIEDNSPERLYQPPDYGIAGAGVGPGKLGHPSSENYKVMRGGKFVEGYPQTLHWDAQDVPKIRTNEF